MHQSGVDALVVDDGGLATPCRYSPPLVRLAVNTLTYCTARRKHSVTVTCGNVRYCVRKQTDIFYDISVSSPGMESHHRPPSHTAFFGSNTLQRTQDLRNTLQKTAVWSAWSPWEAPQCRSSRIKHSGQVGRVLYDLNPISLHMVPMLAGQCIAKLAFGSTYQSHSGDPLPRKLLIQEHLCLVIQSLTRFLLLEKNLFNSLTNIVSPSKNMSSRCKRVFTKCLFRFTCPAV